MRGKNKPWNNTWQSSFKEKNSLKSSYKQLNQSKTATIVTPKVSVPFIDRNTNRSNFNEVVRNQAYNNNHDIINRINHHLSSIELINDSLNNIITWVAEFKSSLLRNTYELREKASEALIDLNIDDFIPDIYLTTGAYTAKDIEAMQRVFEKALAYLDEDDSRDKQRATALVDLAGDYAAAIDGTKFELLSSNHLRDVLKESNYPDIDDLLKKVEEAVTIKLEQALSEGVTLSEKDLEVFRTKFISRKMTEYAHVLGPALDKMYEEALEGTLSSEDMAKFNTVLDEAHRNEFARAYLIDMIQLNKGFKDIDEYANKQAVRNWKEHIVKVYYAIQDVTQPVGSAPRNDITVAEARKRKPKL